MLVGVPSEVKNNENRVALTPSGADALVSRGHSVVVQRGAGLGSRISDDAFRAAGAEVVASADEVWARADLVAKVKEPVPAEYGHLRDGLTIFTYLHLAADRSLAETLLAAGTTAIAYETVQLDDRSLPLLAPMSEVAGRLATSVGAYFLMRAAGGRGTLLGGVAGTPKAKTVVLGGGVAGESAALNAIGLGADVTVVDISVPRLRELELRHHGAISTRLASRYEIADQLVQADLVIGSALVPGATAPRLVTDEMVSEMKDGSVLVDVAIDQGGCFEGSRPTTHEDPVFPVHRSLYYCVANMPGAVPETSTRALTNATIPYLVSLADLGWREATRRDRALARGLNAHAGELLNASVADALGLPLGAH